MTDASARSDPACLTPSTCAPGSRCDDVLDGGLGDDVLIGGAGDDVLLNGEVVFDD